MTQAHYGTRSGRFPAAAGSRDAEGALPDAETATTSGGHQLLPAASSGAPHLGSFPEGDDTVGLPASLLSGAVHECTARLSVSVFDGWLSKPPVASLAGYTMMEAAHAGS